MTLAVTGATGALGRLALDSLLTTEDAGDLVAIVRSAEKAADLAAKGVQVRVADYTDPAALSAALAGVDRLLLVSSNEVGQRFAQHKNVIDAAKQAGVGRVVYTSLSDASESENPLAPEHKQTEEYLADAGVDYTVVRNNWYHENYLAQVPSIAESGVLVAAAGDGKVASASRQDFAEGAARVLATDGHEGKVYEFTGESAWSYHDLAAALSEVVGREVVYQPVDAAELTSALVGSGLDEGTAGFVAALDASIAAGSLERTDATLSRLIGRPTTPLVDALSA